MPADHWLSFNPVFPTSTNASDLWCDFARCLANLPDFEGNQDRNSSIEIVQRQAVRCRDKCDREGRHAFLVAINLLADLAKQGWRVRVTGSAVQIARPEGNVQDCLNGRSRVRTQLHTQRDTQLQQPAVREFVQSVERRQAFNNQFVSIFSLMRDGRELASQLRQVRSIVEEADRKRGIAGVIRPYIQCIRDDERCPTTGLRLLDVWRYFRHTWASPYKSIPGRSMLILVRDAAVRYHPVIGIAALSSPAVAVTVRDERIGWTVAALRREIDRCPSVKYGTWMQQTSDQVIDEIYKLDLLEDEILSPKNLEYPNDEVVARLQAEAKQRRREHFRFMQSGDYKKVEAPNELPEDHWVQQARSPLFRSKRAEELAKLLSVRMVLQRFFGRGVTKSAVMQLINDGEGREALAKMLRKVKADRVGTAIADLTVCGAIPPYSEILGGKLVAMLMTSPEVLAEYHRRYTGICSVIASSMAGRRVCRPADLVFIGTTSLYGQRPSQYDRISIPCNPAAMVGGEAIRYEYLGRTKGLGTFQFGDQTVRGFALLLRQSSAGQQVNSVFGEGVNPRLRKIRHALGQLGLPEDELLEHGTPRLVYGVPLACNTREYLLGLAKRPKYLLPQKNPTVVTQGIVDWWIERWLLRRLNRDDAVDRVARHTFIHPIRHGARVPRPRTDIEQYSLFENG